MFLLEKKRPLLVDTKIYKHKFCIKRDETTAESTASIFILVEDDKSKIIPLNFKTSDQ